MSGTILNYTVVSVEGNIGSGKSTLMSQLKQKYEGNEGVIFLKEPVDEWAEIKDANGITILEKFYGNQEKYSFPFQMMAFISRLNLFKSVIKGLDPSKKYVIITERSLNTDRHVFAKMLFETGKMEDVAYQIYLNWFNVFSADFPVHKVVYVNTCPDICYKRVNVRSREGEQQIPLEYLVSCDTYHNDMLKMDNNPGQLQLTLDGNVDIYECNTQMEEWLNKIDDFIR